MKKNIFELSRKQIHEIVWAFRDALVSKLTQEGTSSIRPDKIINKDIEELFAGLSSRTYDAYIGMNVDECAYMTTLIPSEQIQKLYPEFISKGLVPVHLTTGSFYPPYLLDIDDYIDEQSDSEDCFRFDKAVSARYISKLFTTLFPQYVRKEALVSDDLLYISTHPHEYPNEYATVAVNILRRSARFVAATLAGMVLELRKYNPLLRKVCLSAEGVLFHSAITQTESYSDCVMDELYAILADFGYTDIGVNMEEQMALPFEHIGQIN